MRKVKDESFERTTRRIQRLVRQCELNRKGLGLKARVDARPHYSHDDVVPRSHLIGLGVYFVLESMREWRNQHPRRKTVEVSRLEEWMAGMELTIPIELDPLLEKSDEPS